MYLLINTLLIDFSISLTYAVFNKYIDNRFFVNNNVITTKEIKITLTNDHSNR